MREKEFKMLKEQEDEFMEVELVKLNEVIHLAPILNFTSKFLRIYLQIFP